MKINMHGDDHSPKKAHADYEINLRKARDYIYANQSKLPNGMSVKICDSEQISSALVAISFSNAYTPNYAANISLHQPGYVVADEVTKAMKAICAIAEKVNNG